VPDPQDAATFERSRIHPGRTADAGQTALLQWYRELIRLRTNISPLGAAATAGYECHVSVHADSTVLAVHRGGTQGNTALILLGFNPNPTTLILREPAGTWTLRLESENKTFGGNGHTALPERLVVVSEGVALTLAPYQVALYLSQPS
jgi:hypothetical protein